MGVFKDLQGKGYMIMMQMQLLIIKFIVLLGWLFGMAMAQLELSETVTGWVNFPAVGITCLGNMALFITSMLRGRLYLEMGARDVIATVTDDLKEINGFGLTTLRVRKPEDIHNLGRRKKEYRDASVVMLSSQVSNSSIKQFMKYIYNTHDVNSILLKCLLLKSASAQSALESASVTVELCDCNCNCIVFWTIEEITIELARKMPRTVKKLSNTLCLLPSRPCMRKACHGCNQDLFHMEETENGARLKAGDFDVEFSVVSEALDFELTTAIQEKPICICIPLREDWTELLARSFKSKDQEERGTEVMASDALESYLAGSVDGRAEKVSYTTASLIVPRFIEVLINLVLTGLFKVDGFSSSLVARRAIRRYVLDSKGNGFAANAFLTDAQVFVDLDANNTNTSVCQVLSFRGTLLGFRTLSFIVGCVNLICSVIWAVLVAFGGTGKWYEIQSMPPSKPRVAVIIATICVGLGMDCLELFSKKISRRKRLMLRAVIVLETTCIGSGSAVAGALGIRAFGKWVYTALQGLVWVKWGTGSYLLGEYSPEYGHIPASRVRMGTEPQKLMGSSARWIDKGTLVYSSAFLLNAVLAGVRGQWK